MMAKLSILSAREDQPRDHQCYDALEQLVRIFLGQTAALHLVPFTLHHPAAPTQLWQMCSLRFFFFMNSCYGPKY